MARLEDLTRGAAIRGILDEEFPEGDAFAVREERAPYGAPAGCVVRYVRRPFTREPDFGATSVNYDWRELWGRGAPPG